MKEKILKLFDKKYAFTYIFICVLIITLFISTVLYRNSEYGGFELHVPFNTDFGTLTYCIIIPLAVIYYFVFKNAEKKNFKIENIFLSLAIPLGILFCIANPLGRVPDEDVHAKKSFAISEGLLFSSSYETADTQAYINAKVHELVSETTKSYDEYFKKLNMAETDQKSLQNYKQMALYSPMSHAPQAIGIAISRLFGATVTVQCYAARLFNMAVAICLLYFAIKLIPFKKHIIFFIGLLPMTLNEIASMSSDALAISNCIFFICYILYLKYDPKKEMCTIKDYIILVVSSLVIALVKTVYVPLCLLLFLIPKDKFKSNKVKIIFCILTIIISLILNLGWLAYCSRFLIEYTPGVDAHEQVKYVLSNPIRYIIIIFRAITVYFQNHVVALCGEDLGSHNAQASLLYVIPTIILFTGLFFINDDKERKEFDIFTKLYILVVFLMCYALIYTSVYVHWNALGNQIVIGVQARYFIPILPLLMILFDNKLISLNKKISKNYLYMYMLFFNLNALCCIAFTYMYNVIEYYVK